MKTALAAILAVAGLLLAGARAEESAAGAGFDGPWRGEFTAKSGRSRQLDLDIAGDRATLVYERQGGKWDNGCIGPQLPAKVARRSAAGVTLQIDAEQVLKGCGKYDLVLKPGDAPDRLVGEFPNGIVVQLKRR